MKGEVGPTFQLFFTESTPPTSLLAATAAVRDDGRRDDLFLLPIPESNCSGGFARCSVSSLLGLIIALGIFSGGNGSSFPLSSLPLVFLLLLSPFFPFSLLASSPPSAAAARNLMLRHEEGTLRNP